MTRLKLNSTPAFRISVPRNPAESRPVRQGKAVPEPTRPQVRDGFESGPRRASGRHGAGDVFIGHEKGTRGAKSAPGPVGSSPLSEKLEPFKDKLNEIAQKAAQDTTLDNKGKVKKALRDAIKDLGLSGRDLRDALKETERAYGYYKGISDPDFGASGGIYEK